MIGIMKRPKLNARQLYEKDIRDSATSYTAWMWVPSEGLISKQSESVHEIKVLAREMWDASSKTRPVLINAVRADGRFATLGQWAKSGYREFPI